MSGPDTSIAKRLREIFEILVRTMKTLSLYEARNPVSETLESTLHSRLAELLDEVGPLELRVLRHQILYGEEVIYENRERKDSLAFLFSRDGIHGLTFQPGLVAEELHRFVSCLNRARLLVGDEDDLATLLWEEGLESIDYDVVDELTDTTVGTEEPEPLFGSGWSGGSAQESAAVTAGGRSEVTLEDLRPSPRLPVSAARLSAAESAAIQDQLAEESAADLPSMAIELATELVMLESDATQRRTLEGALEGVLNGLLVDNRPADFLRAFERLSDLAQGVFAEEDAVQALHRRVRSAAAEPAQLARFLEAVAGELDLANPVAGFLRRLPDSAVPTLVSALGQMRHPRLRRALSDAILVHGVQGPKLLIDQLPALRCNGETRVIDELFHMLRRLPQDDACTLVERLLGFGDPELAHRGALILGQLRGQRVERMLLQLLEAGDPQTTFLAISALARSGNRSLAPRLLERVLELEGRGPESEEFRRQLAAIGRLGGDSLLPVFGRLLRERSRGWLPSREKWELARALVHGMGAVGSEASEARLEELALGGNRMMRSICRDELSGSL